MQNSRLKRNALNKDIAVCNVLKQLCSANLLWEQNEISQENISQYKIWRGILTANDNKRN